MFDNDKFITKGVQQVIPLEFQLLMWNCVDRLKEQGQLLDYLQVFQFTKQRIDDIFFQKIDHRQELPEYIETYNVFSSEIINAKVFIIDDGAYSTMLLAEEY